MHGQTNIKRNISQKLFIYLLYIVTELSASLVNAEQLQLKYLYIWGNFGMFRIRSDIITSA
jgi:hypothetical protein